MPLAEDWPVLRAGQPLLESTSEIATDLAGVPESNSWEANWSFFCSVSFFGKDTEAHYQGHGTAVWRNVSETTRDTLFEEMSVMWKAEGLLPSQTDLAGESSISADPPGFFISAHHYAAADGDIPPGTFTISVLTRCYTWDELRASQTEADTK